MSGHSKWSTIKRQKGTADIKRGQAFTKLANVITIAVKAGGSGDPGANPRLRTVLEEAKSLNMPKDNIQRAIDRGLGVGKEALEEVTYEGFGPGKVAFYLEGITDNKLRTLQEVKNLFERSGGSLGGSGSTAYMFDKKGAIKVKSKKEKEEDILTLIDLGAEDVESFDFAQDFADAQEKQGYLVYVQSPELNTMSTKITQAGFGVESAEIIMKPNILQKIDDPELTKKVIEFAGKLEEMDDIQKVYANFDIDEKLIG
ncbi:YebC/PmpR family DNA-binding transcriptional regulator [Candidatus Daviesbacteria bacterium]|nr:YebC/PmpR family DNA-binding transcriptional regulator [Candidatus Daviesbacteria bacterium]